MVKARFVSYAESRVHGFVAITTAVAIVNGVRVRPPEDDMMGIVQLRGGRPSAIYEKCEERCERYEDVAGGVVVACTYRCREVEGAAVVVRPFMERRSASPDGEFAEMVREVEVLDEEADVALLELSYSHGAGGELGHATLRYYVLEDGAWKHRLMLPLPRDAEPEELASALFS